MRAVGDDGWRRCHVARGLRCAASNDAVGVSALAAPSFAVAFYLEEPMSIPILAQRALWALNYVQCCLQKGEHGALMTKIPGLCCDLHHNIVSTTDDVDGTPLSVVPLMRIQLRILRVREEQEEQRASYYMLLVVMSPAAFSLRKAIQATSGSANRRMLTDINYTDKRRAVWSELAIHASQYVHMSDDRVASYGTSLDWLHAPDGRGFSALFSVHAAMDWVKMHFVKQHRCQGGVVMTGFDEEAFSSGRGDNFLTGPFLAACRQYHLAVDAGVADTYQSMKNPTEKKKKKRNRGGNNNNGGEADEEDDALRELPLPPCILAGIELPRCDMALDVILSVQIEAPPPFEDFRMRVKNFPQYVSMHLLTAKMGLTEEILSSLLHSPEADDEDDEDLVDDATVKNIMLHGPLDTRSMLSGRDAGLGEQMRALLRVGDNVFERFMQGLRLTLAIVRTRAVGSDNYTQERVAVFNERLLTRSVLSREACVRVHYEMCHVFAAGQPQLQRRRMGNCDDEAQRFVARCLSSSNAEQNLKPDNFFLLTQLIWTDLMLSLDYHRSTLEAAPNGIGATLIVCDGGGNFRYDNAGLVVYSKTNGTGADHVMNAYMKLGHIPHFLTQVSSNRPRDCNYFEELKHATELSIVQTVCNSYIGTGEDATVDRTISEAMKRTYATEFVANNSQAAMNCMKALSWLVERNTTMNGDSGVYKTTSETDEKKGRHTFVYRPAIGGLVLLCSNAVHPVCYERFHTIAQVSRKIASSAHVWSTSSGGGDEVHLETLVRIARPLFSDVMCTAVNAAFAQWTGALGHIAETAAARALVAAIHHQLDLSSSLFNPDMTGCDKKRFRQVSRSRSVPVALLTLAARETSEAGRRGEDHRAAVERTCRALMSEGTYCAAWWLCAELLEHTLRCDFFYVMQMLAKAFQVPKDLSLDEVLDWIGGGGGGERVQAFFDGREFMGATHFEPELGIIARVEHCLYLRHPELEVAGLNLMTDATTEEHKTAFCRKIGSVLQGWSKQALTEGCRIKDNEMGRQVVTYMLQRCINEPFKWPSMFAPPPLQAFWKGRHPGATDRSLAPLRMIHTGSGKAVLGVDLRWLLLCGAMGGDTPSQTQRFMIVRHLTRGIVRTCLPRRMLTTPRLFIGLPHACMERGMEPLDVSAALPGRRLLLRHTRSMGMDAPIVPTGMVEDLGPAGPRLQLTRLLLGQDDCLPTDAAHAPLPHDLWTPVELESDLRLANGTRLGKGSYAALKTSNGGTFWLSVRDPATGAVLPPLDVTDGDYLYGRVSVPVRPMCVFDRPGVLVQHDGDAAVLLSVASAMARMEDEDVAPALLEALASLRETDGAIFYVALRWQRGAGSLRLIELTPREVWDGIVAPDTFLLIETEGLAPHNLTFVPEDGGGLLVCRLDSQGAPEDLDDDFVFVRVRRTGGVAFDDGGGILSYDENMHDDYASFAVHIRYVVRIWGATYNEAENAGIFCAIAQ